MDQRFKKLHVSKNLKKPVVLPHLNEFSVHPEEIVVTDSISSNVKSKGLFVNRTSPTVDRQMALTKHGYLIIWMKSNEGFVLDIREASSVMTVFKTNKKFGMVTHNCDLKMKFASGTVNLFLKNEKISKWRAVIGDLYDGVAVAESGKKTPANMDETRVEIENSGVEETENDQTVLEDSCPECGIPTPKSDPLPSSGSSLSVLRSDTQLSGKESTKSISTRSPIMAVTPVTPKTPVVPLEQLARTPVTPPVPMPKSVVKTPDYPRTPKMIRTPVTPKDMNKPKEQASFCLDYTVPVVPVDPFYTCMPLSMGPFSGGHKIPESILRARNPLDYTVPVVPVEPVFKAPLPKPIAPSTSDEFKKPNLFLRAPKPRKTTKVVPVVYRPQQTTETSDEKEPRHSIRSGTLTVSAIRKLLETKSRTEVLKATAEAEPVKKPDTPRPLKMESGPPKKEKMSFVTSRRLPSIFGVSLASGRGTEPGRCESAPAAFNYDDILYGKEAEPQLMSPEKEIEKIDGVMREKEEQKTVKFNSYDGWEDSVRM